MASGEALADVGQADASATAGRRIRIEAVFDGDRECAIARMDFEFDRAAFDEIRDSVDDGIFDQRLQQQRRHENVERVFIDIFFHLDAGAEADFFDGEK